MAKFEAQALGCHRGGRLVFAGLQFALEAGDALVLRGPNGSGKSSLLRLLALLTPSRGGALRWQDQPLDRDAHRARLRFVGHADALKPALGVLENLLFIARLTDPTVAHAQCHEALERFDLGRLAAQPTRFLSAGQKRRLALARLVATPGELWLLDEPATALDAKAMQSLAAVMTAFRQRGGIIVLSTHGDLPLADARQLELTDFAPEMAA
jgi:heme exporter protein A